MLVLVGRLSDQVGRRPVLLVALAALMGTTVLFMVADSVVWLFAARGLQGLATGAALGAASAALLDLHPSRDPTAAGLANGVVSAGGLGLGVLVSAGRALSAALPPEHRASVMSAFYIVAYLALSLPAVAAGVLVTSLGLRPTFELFGGAIAALALVVAFEAWRTRPPSRSGRGRAG
jgi:MFS family permease